MDCPISMAEVVHHSVGSLPLWLSADVDILACGAGRPPQSDHSGHVSHFAVQRLACCWLQGNCAIITIMFPSHNLSGGINYRLGRYRK